VNPIAAALLLVAGVALLQPAKAQTITLRIDTPEFGIRVGPNSGGTIALGPIPIHSMPSMAVSPPVVLHPMPVFAPPTWVIVPAAVYLPERAIVPHRRGHFVPPGHRWKYDPHVRHRYGRHRGGRDDD